MVLKFDASLQSSSFPRVVYEWSGLGSWRLDSKATGVVVKIMVPLEVLNIIRQLIAQGPGSPGPGARYEELYNGL